MKDPSSVNLPFSPSPYSAMLSVSDSDFLLSAVNERFSSSISLQAKNVTVYKQKWKLLENLRPSIFAETFFFFEHRLSTLFLFFFRN